MFEGTYDERHGENRHRRDDGRSRASARSSARGDREPLILDAANELLDEIGYDHLRVQERRRPGHVGLATIYRRWVDEAGARHRRDESRKTAVERPETDDPRADLESFLREMTNDIFGPKSCFVVGFVTALRNDPELARVFRESLLTDARSDPPPDRARCSRGRPRPRLASILHLVLIFRSLIDDRTGRPRRSRARLCALVLRLGRAHTRTGTARVLTVGVVALGVSDVSRAAEFWRAALGLRRAHRRVGGWSTVLVPPAGVPEPKIALQRSETPAEDHPRIHLDLQRWPDVAEQRPRRRASWRLGGPNPRSNLGQRLTRGRNPRGGNWSRPVAGGGGQGPPPPHPPPPPPPPPPDPPGPEGKNRNSMASSI